MASGEVFVISGGGVCDIRERCLSHKGAVFLTSGRGVCDIGVRSM